MDRDQIFSDARRREQAISKEHNNRMEKEPDDFSIKTDLNRLDSLILFHHAMIKTWENAKKELQDSRKDVYGR